MRQAAIKKVVKWWSDKINLTDKHDLGVNSFQEFAVEFTINSLADDNAKAISNERVKLFEETLEADLLKKSGEIVISIDYEVPDIFSNAIKTSGIDNLHLPIKSCTIISKDNKVSTKHGYTGKWEELK